MGGYCAHFLFDIYRGFSLNGIFFYHFFDGLSALSGSFNGQAYSLRAKLARSPASLSFPASLLFDSPSQKFEIEERPMAKMNLRDYYPFYNTDFIVDIPDEVNDALLEAERLERNYIRHFKSFQYYLVYLS